jgi:hypothetical protein
MLGAKFLLAVIAIEAIMPTILLKPQPLYAKTYHALCSMYTEYYDCNVNISKASVAANFPTGYHIFNSENVIEVRLYDARRKEPYYALGIATTIILGPIGLLGFLASKSVGDVDYGFTFRDEQRLKTAFIRFKNNQVSAEFAESLKPFLLGLPPTRQ